ncbi:MAG: alginate lyase family protein [Xenococcaceae cyanobacterium]
MEMIDTRFLGKNRLFDQLIGSKDNLSLVNDLLDSFKLRNINLESEAVFEPDFIAKMKTAFGSNFTDFASSLEALDGGTGENGQTHPFYSIAHDNFSSGDRALIEKLLMVVDELTPPSGDPHNSLASDNFSHIEVAPVNNQSVAPEENLLTNNGDVDLTPRVFILDPDLLESTKQLVQQGDPRIAPAIEELVEQADQALNQPLLTVTDGETPPSGDPHDYMSLSIYWWPNPDTPDGLPYVERDGEVNPEVYNYDGPKISLMARTVETLALGYYFTGNEDYAEHAANLIKTWFLDEDTRMNPNLNHGQFIPGINTGSRQGIIETAVLATDVIDSVGLIADSQHWTETDQTDLESWFESYGQWLRTSWLGIQEAFRTNNHGMWYDVQLTTFDRFVGDDISAKQRLMFITPLRILTQVESDGSQPQELSRATPFFYSLYNLEAMFNLASIGEKLGVDLWNFKGLDGRGIEKALNYLLPDVWPHGQSSPESLFPFLRQAALAYQNPDYEQLIDELPGSADQRAASRINLLYPDPDIVDPALLGIPAPTDAEQGDFLTIAATTIPDKESGSGDTLLEGGLSRTILGGAQDMDAIIDLQNGLDPFLLTEGVTFNDPNINQNIFGDTLLSSGEQLLATVIGTDPSLSNL